ncbi:MAG: hypothetical protein VW338_04675, partial [Rhodospirillaceae bacterium]
MRGLWLLLGGLGVTGALAVVAGIVLGWPVLVGALVGTPAGRWSVAAAAAVVAVLIAHAVGYRSG